MADQTGIKWPTCDEDACIGVRLAATAKCLAHARDEQRNATLKQLGETGEINARGVPITQGLFEQILAAAPHDAEDRPTFMSAGFNRATFQGPARFARVAFKGAAWFGGATFQDTAEFDGATFQDAAWFQEVTFRGTAGFEGATFQGAAQFKGVTFEDTAETAKFYGATFKGIAWFEGATFKGGAGFGGATFQDTASFTTVAFQDGVWFDGATFKCAAQFKRATFKGVAWFGGATFRDTAGFQMVTFQDTVWFDRATFRGEAVFRWVTFQGAAGFRMVTFQDTVWFDRATFRGATEFGGTIVRRNAQFIKAEFAQADQLGPLLVYDLLRLDGASFTQPVQIEASSRELSCQRARFLAGVQFRLRGAQIVLDEAELPGPSQLTGVAALSDARLARREQRLAQAVWRLAPAAAAEWSSRPRLLSVQGVNVAGLGLANVDLAECRFAGAHNLHKLRMEVDVSFAVAPDPLGLGWRRVIAEERAWRAARPARSKRWIPLRSPPAWVDHPYGTKWPRVLPPQQIAPLYWGLRKGREEDKDEVGAGDFYYGEMEMRRHTWRRETSNGPNMWSRRHRLVERGILTAYWVISGYGLRGWRALAWLVIAVIAAAIGLHAVGFANHRHPWGSAFLYTAGAVTHMLDPPDGLLTEAGQAIRIAIGLLGPVLLGLGFALLALPYRAKR